MTYDYLKILTSSSGASLLFLELLFKLHMDSSLERVQWFLIYTKTSGNSTD